MAPCPVLLPAAFRGPASSMMRSFSSSAINGVPRPSSRSIWSLPSIRCRSFPGNMFSSVIPTTSCRCALTRSRMRPGPMVASPSWSPRSRAAGPAGGSPANSGAVTPCWSPDPMAPSPPPASGSSDPCSGGRIRMGADSSAGPRCGHPRTRALVHGLALRAHRTRRDGRRPARPVATRRSPVRVRIHPDPGIHRSAIRSNPGRPAHHHRGPLDP